MSVVTQSIHKSHSIAKFQTESRRGNSVCLIIQPCVLNLWRGWWAIDFQVPKRPFFFCSVQIEIHLYTWRPFSFFGSAMFYSPILLLFYRSFHVFLTIAICIYLCFAGEVVFRFLAFGFISHTTRISNNTSFLCKRLVVKKINLETIFPAFTKLKCFALDIQSQRI